MCSQHSGQPEKSSEKKIKQRKYEIQSAHLRLGETWNLISFHPRSATSTGGGRYSRDRDCSPMSAPPPPIHGWNLQSIPDRAQRCPNGPRCRGLGLWLTKYETVVHHGVAHASTVRLQQQIQIGSKSGPTVTQQ